MRKKAPKPQNKLVQNFLRHGYFLSDHSKKTMFSACKRDIWFYLIIRIVVLQSLDGIGYVSHPLEKNLQHSGAVFNISHLWHAQNGVAAHLLDYWSNYILHTQRGITQQHTVRAKGAITSCCWMCYHMVLDASAASEDLAAKKGWALQLLAKWHALTLESVVLWHNQVFSYAYIPLFWHKFIRIQSEIGHE